MQLLPESSSSLIRFIVGLVPLSLFAARERAASGGGAATGASDDMEVKVGVPRF